MKPNITETYTSKGMRYPALNDLIAKANNKYELVLATAKRAREIIDGDEPLVKITIDNPVSIATAEIAEGLVRPENPALNASEEAAAPQEDVFPEDEESAAPTIAEMAEEA
ncbi:MAG: DNA-directed RNA polymerase subunit omega [Eubacterium sp.]|nr:DNA-directed RNA polymerase subunit omega [Eubacterium sp.]